MSDWRTCDICNIPGVPKNPVIRFGLRRYKTFQSESGHWSSRTTAAGSLDVCAECWGKYAKPRMVPQRSARRKAS